MVKNIRHIILLLLLLCGSNSLSYIHAQYYGRSYYSQREESCVGFYASGAFAANPSSIEGISIDKGHSHDFGFAYQYRYRSFLLFTGVGFQWQVASEKFDDMSVWHEPMVDTQGDEYTLNYSLLRSDFQRVGQIEVPLLLGQQVGRFYYLLGPKAYLNLFGDTKQKLRITTTATYDQYFSPLWGMANHGLRTDVHQDYKGKKMDYLADIRMTFEAGWNLFDGGRSYGPNTLVRLAAFAEGGVLLPRPSSTVELPLVVTTPFNYSEWATCNVLNSTHANDHWIGSLNVGLRLTVLFSTSSSYHHSSRPGCVECREAKRPRFKHKCVICEEEKRQRRKKH